MLKREGMVHSVLGRGSYVSSAHPGLPPAARTEPSWWTLDDLRDTTKTVYPVGLADLVSRFLYDGPPLTPTQLG
ncbi:hypothetical protein [Streptomyces sp. NPDC056682]|uniref:hypothetical protein n=1 Tax=Streptomyces sp. NPDC056682 TaxID=3345909 RepID=UPI003696C6C6